MDDLDAALFEKARSLIRGYRSDHPWLMLSNKELLQSSSLRLKDYKTGKEGLTLAAVEVLHGLWLDGRDWLGRKEHQPLPAALYGRCIANV